MASTTPAKKRVDFKLHEKQAEVFYNPCRFRVVVAGRRFGKTKLSMLVMLAWATKKLQKIWYVAPTYRMAKQIMWNDLKSNVPMEWVSKIRENELSMEFRNGSVISLRGADKPDSLRGVSLDFLVLDEFQDIAADTWTTVLRPTLADRRGNALFIGTPKGYNQLYKLYKVGQNKANQLKKEWMSWQFPTITSPFIPKSEIEAARRDMDEKSYRAEFLASFESMSGRVYYAFDRKSNVANVEFNPRLPIWVGMDFNIDPMSTVIFQPQPNGQLWAVDEIVQISSNTDDICTELEKRYYKYQDRVIIYPDPAGSARQHARGESDLDIMREHGFKRIKVKRAHSAVADRVNAVNRMLRSASGEVRLFISPKCKHLIDSFEQTLYIAGSRDVDKSLGVEHSADAAGYCIELEFPLRKFTPIGFSR